MTEHLHTVAVLGTHDTQKVVAGLVREATWFEVTRIEDRANHVADLHEIRVKYAEAPVLDALVAEFGR